MVVGWLIGLDMFKDVFDGKKAAPPPGPGLGIQLPSVQHSMVWNAGNSFCSSNSSIDLKCFMSDGKGYW